jgi:hypothetical protein
VVEVLRDSKVLKEPLVLAHKELKEFKVQKDHKELKVPKVPKVRFPIKD